jgi:hypothetical protein
MELRYKKQQSPPAPQNLNGIAKLLRKASGNLKHIRYSYRDYYEEMQTPNKKTQNNLTNQLRTYQR